MSILFKNNNKYKKHKHNEESDKSHNYIPFSEMQLEIPSEIHEAANLISNYFKKQGIEKWRFAGLADRKLVNDFDALSCKLKEIQKVLSS